MSKENIFANEEQSIQKYEGQNNRPIGWGLLALAKAVKYAADTYFYVNHGRYRGSEKKGLDEVEI